MIGQLPSFPPFFFLFIRRSLAVVNKLSNRYVFAFQRRQWFIPGEWTPSPIAVEENTYLPAGGVRARQRRSEGGVCSLPSILQPGSGTLWWNVCLWRCVPWLLFSYFSPNWWPPAALNSPYLSSLDFPPCQRASSRLLSASWSSMNKTAPNFKTVPYFASLCIWKTHLHCAAAGVLIACKSTQRWLFGSWSHFIYKSQ